MFSRCSLGTSTSCMCYACDAEKHGNDLIVLPLPAARLGVDTFSQYPEPFIKPCNGASFYQKGLSKNCYEMCSPPPILRIIALSAFDEEKLSLFPKISWPDLAKRDLHSAH